GTVTQRPDRRLLDRRPVHHGVGEGDADLDGVGAGVGNGGHHLAPVASQAPGDVGDEQLAPRVARGAQRGLDLAELGQDRSSRTWATSLSPRPERVISTVAPAGSSWVPAARATHARAWADSRAGMMPSVSLSRRKASSTSASPADT